jgi:hypothetical protein
LFVGPLLDKHKAQRIFAIDMYCVRDAARLRARAMNMLKAESANLIEGFGFGDGVSCHDNHAFLRKCSWLKSILTPDAMNAKPETVRIQTRRSVIFTASPVVFIYRVLG